ncbi:Protein PIH1D3 [Orchesella cincta]|uniref:Protein PIH1D3 n=1 Tax=Orchesella cincta TaxID=48709 RepID=A0A1D2NG66_ORCCI|nr:Protein PIH1D3 [Orchesella cincta]
MSLNSIDVTSLASMLQSCDPNYVDDSDDSDIEGTCTSKLTGPGQIGANKCEMESGKSKPEGLNKSEIWSPIEVGNDARSNQNAKDGRKTPKYDMFYRQSVTSEDIFLQMGNKTPSSASCENLVVEIHLPQEDDFNNIQLNLKEQAIDLRSPSHFLYLGLPHPINTNAGHAKWDKDAEKLIVTLKLARELDGLNF